MPFGTALNAESTITSNPNRFTSYDRSSRTGLDYAVNRNYDSKQGRFTNVDPIGMSAANIANPQSNNLYAYVENDPINYSDPSGLLMIPPTAPEGCYIITRYYYVNGEYDSTGYFLVCPGGGTSYLGTRDRVGVEIGGGGGINGGGTSLGVDTHRPLESFGRSDNCDDLKGDIAYLEKIIAIRKEEGKVWALQEGKRRMDDTHQKRLNNTRAKLEDIKNKYKKLGCDGGGDDPKPSPVPVPVPAPAPTPSAENMKRRENWEIGPGGVAIGTAGTIVVVYVVGKKVVGTGLLFTPFAPAGAVLIITP